MYSPSQRRKDINVAKAKKLKTKVFAIFFAEINFNVNYFYYKFMMNPEPPSCVVEINKTTLFFFYRLDIYIFYTFYICYYYIIFVFNVYTYQSRIIFNLNINLIIFQIFLLVLKIFPNFNNYCITIMINMIYIALLFMLYIFYATFSLFVT